ncbi:MAG: hypothetical protein M3440_08715 [Chloroflexota bacterium]|nr:hypothetical protein [Chloroflexota bacterium]
MKSQLAQPSQSFSRRAFLESFLATAIGGSAIAAFVVQGKLRLLVVGEDEWQIALLLAARTRVLILTGALTQDAMAAIPMLLSVMRQRIDVVIDSSASLASLPDGFRQRWMVRRIIPLADDGASSTEMTSLDQVLYIPGALRVNVSASPRGFWTERSGGSDRTATGLVTISAGGSIIAIARNLETIADLGPALTTLAIAPVGSIDRVARRLRVPTICINADQVRDQKIDFGGGGLVASGARSLVRVFPQDVAEFRLLEDGIAIPAWRQTIASA